MAATYKVLGQSAPSATTETTLYTVPSSTSSIVSTITVCNRDTASGTFRIAIRPAGASLANQHAPVSAASSSTYIPPDDDDDVVSTSRCWFVSFRLSSPCV